jgi:hypothetical protein
MKTQEKLLLDLISLLERYSPADWENAIRLLRDVRFRKRFFSVLDLLSTLSKERTPNPIATPSPNFSRKLREGRLSAVRADKLTTERLRSILAENKIKFSSKDSRQRLLQKFLRIKHLNSLVSRQSASGNYEDWVDIIMRRRKS